MKQREYYFDNAKFLLIFFVVFGHFIQSFIKESNSIYALYKVIYTFHMPAFILISGFFAKGIYQQGYIQKYAKKLILPYIIFQLIYSVFYYFLYGKSTFNVEPLNPHWSLWFLISLFFWNMMLLLFAKIKPVFGLVIALLLGLSVGFVDWTTSYLSLTRTFVFFPLFLIGFYMKKEHFIWIRTKKARLTAITTFIIVFIGFYHAPSINYQWLFGSKSYSSLAEDPFQAIFIRLFFYVLSCMMIYCFFACVPNKQYFFTKLGKNTLYVYLLHGFIVRIFRVSDMTDLVNPPKSFILIIAVSFLLTLLLSSSMITSLAQPIIELKITKLQQLQKKWSNLFQGYKAKLFE
ncbi:acyltransferase family protein [Niallia sp. 03133]|uniref:acyltransferase family protein n=1 Tax=Niallia sp. 03133 TaxID=3458060 RepID=UPI004044FD2A